MDERSALLAEVRANPDDDVPRLVYADWLQENEADKGCVECQMQRDFAAKHYPPGTEVYCRICNDTGRVSNGNAARAEFIRVQCELAGLTDPWDTPDCYCERLEPGFKCRPCLDYGRAKDELRERERELLTPFEPEPTSVNWTDWTRGLPKIGWHCGNIDTRLNEHVAPAVWFVRGFVGRIRMPWADWHAHHAAILAHPDVVLCRVTLTTRVPDTELQILYHRWKRQTPDKVTANWTDPPTKVMAQVLPLEFPGHCPNHLITFGIPCTRCNGTGTVRTPCPDCKGEGVII